MGRMRDAKLKFSVSFASWGKNFIALKGGIVGSGGQWAAVGSVPKMFKQFAAGELLHAIAGKFSHASIR